MDCDNAITKARVLRAAASLRRINMLLCWHWVDRLEQQLAAEECEARAAALDAAVQEYELNRVALLARGAVPDPTRLQLQWA